MCSLVIESLLLTSSIAAFYAAENCIVVAEGEIGHNGIFRVIALGFPTCESREELPATAQKINFFGGPMLGPEDQARLELAELDAQEDRIVFLSNVWLDRPGTFESLHTLLSGRFYNNGCISVIHHL